MRRDKMNTILFDLDGTLLPLDMEEFTKAYFSELCKKLAPKLDPQTLPKLVWASTDYMIKNLDKDKTNMESFFEDFQKSPERAAAVAEKKESWKEYSYELKYSVQYEILKTWKR